MKTFTQKLGLCSIAAALVLVLVLMGGYVFSDQGGVMQTYKNATAPIDDEARLDVLIEVPDDIVLVDTRYQGGRFWTRTRKDKIERFQCSQCHNNKKVTVTKAKEIAHGDIVLNHGGEAKQLDCMTCHNKENRDFLVTEAGTKIDMDDSYQMCGQCHFRQKKDWVGGAHGKRVGYWAGKRVVENCASCHNPHSPRFKSRWPKTYSPPFEK
jgi:formate-dependent nitrite reductase cytochrome c552 subunit